MPNILKILIIDGDEIDRMVIIRELNKTETKVEIQEAPDAETALAEIKQQKFSCIFLSCDLPNKNGLTFLKQLKKSGNIKVPIIMLIEVEEDELIIRTLRYGVQDYLVKKNINGKRLIRSIKYSIERKRIQDILQLSDERYRAIFDQAADSIVLVDAETGELVDFNTKAHESLGYTREQFEKLKIPDFEVIESTEEVEKHIKKIAVEGADSFETKHRRRNGELRDVQVNSKAISIKSKTFIQSIWRDITETKHMEEENRRLFAEAEKAKIVDQLKEQNILLEEKNVALRHVMEQVKVERTRVEDQIIANVEEILLPIILKIRNKCSEVDKKYVDLLEENLKTLTSSFGDKISRKMNKLTTKEIEVCNMIRNGLTSKEISALLHNSYKTIEKQRKIIRKKLGITDRAVNLTSFLKNL